MKETKDKESIKITLNNLKKGFILAIKDKKRWMVCLIEVLIVGALIAVDLLTKHFIYGHCVEHGRINIIEGVICFTDVKNTGASFGIFAGKTLELTIISTICAFILLIFIFYSYPRRNLWLRSSLILILAGAVGNIVDRIAFGYVRDFVYFELINFAVFNFADSCLTVGTIVLLIYVIFFYSKDEKEFQEKKAMEKQQVSLSNSEKASDELDFAQSATESIETAKCADEETEGQKNEEKQLKKDDND